MSPSGAGLSELRIDADPAAWADVGFSLDQDRLRVGSTVIRFQPGCRTEAGAICSWTLAGVGEGEFDGLPTGYADTVAPGEAPEHPSSVLRVDHVVVFSSDLERTISSFESSGVGCRRIREAPIDAGRIRQAFFRLGETIVEVVQVPAENAGPEGRARFWGLAFVVADIEQAADLLGDRLGRVKDAVQPGRRIATIRKQAGLNVSVALITPEPAG